MLQVAADGGWERAQVVRVADGVVRALAAVGQVARLAQDNLAVEVLWPACAFVGVRWAADREREAADAVARASVALANPSHTPGAHPLEIALLALLGTTPASNVELAELGAVNAWRSMVPEVLWRKGDRDDTVSAENLDRALRRRPDLTSCVHPVAVEFAVTQPQPCWVGVDVSVDSGPVHRLDRQALDDALDRVIQTRSASRSADRRTDVRPASLG